MADFKDDLKIFIINELIGMANNVESNYIMNFDARKTNPFLLFDNSIDKYMGLGRSIDSQLGNRIQRIILYIARKRFGLINTPNCICIDIEDNTNIKCILYSVRFDLPESEQNKNFNPYKQYIYINAQKKEKDIKKDLKIKAESTSLKKHIFEINGVASNVIDYLNSCKKKIPVDLLYFDCNFENEINNVNTFEIKMGGRLDTKNASANADEVLHLNRIFAFLHCNKSYFATCYDNCSDAVKNEITKKISAESVVCGKAFWDVLFSGEMNITYEQFIEIYKEAFVASGIEEKINQL